MAGDTGTDGCISTDDVGGGGVRVDTKVDIAQCAQPVSYTHLDVYKRQGLEGYATADQLKDSYFCACYAKGSSTRCV